MVTIFQCFGKVLRISRFGAYVWDVRVRPSVHNVCFVSWCSPCLLPFWYLLRGRVYHTSATALLNYCCRYLIYIDSDTRRLLKQARHWDDDAWWYVYSYLPRTCTRISIFPVFFHLTEWKLEVQSIEPFYIASAIVYHLVSCVFCIIPIVMYDLFSYTGVCLDEPFIMWWVWLSRSASAPPPATTSVWTSLFLFMCEIFCSTRCIMYVRRLPYYCICIER